MRSWIILAILAVLPNRSIVKQQGSVIFPALGKVTIAASLPLGSFPTLTFHDAQDRLLLRMQLGKENETIFRMVPEENTDGDENPILRFETIKLPSNSPAVLTIAGYRGGSDCGYVANVVSEHQGKLRPWFATYPGNNAEGGLYVGDLGGSRGFGVASWNFVWADGESHVDPHRYRIRLYRYDESSGLAQLFFDKTTVKKYEDPTHALKEFGLTYKDMIGDFKDLSC